jgi:hypothetical protein
VSAGGDAARAPRGRSLDLIVVALLIAVTTIFFVAAPPFPEYSADPAARTAPADDSDLPVQDFAYIFNYARYAAGIPGNSPYSIPAHRRFLSEWLGPDVASCACFAYSPTMVLLLAPLLPFSTGVAWLLWDVMSVVVLVAGLAFTNRRDRSLASVARLGIVGPTMFYALAWGQTALLTTGVAALAVELERDSGLKRWCATWVAAAALVVLTIKPPLALLLAAALLAARRFRTLGIASVGVLAIAIAAVVWWSPGIVRDYVDLVGNYNLVDAPPLFRAGFKPEQMTNLRHMLLATGLFDDSQASRLTWIPLVVLMLPAVVSLVRGNAVPVPIAAAFAATAYALFSPHLSPTEDLIMIAVMCWLWPASGPRTRVLLAVMCVGIQFLGAVRFSFAHVLGEDSSVLDLIPLVGFWAKLVVGVVAAQVLSRRLMTPAATEAQLSD